MGQFAPQGNGFPLAFCAQTDYYSSMPKRSSKKDVNQMAFAIMQEASGLSEPRPVSVGKNPAAVALGRMGGLKGGKARAEKLSPERRREIAKQAAEKRWKKDKSK